MHDHMHSCRRLIPALLRFASPGAPHEGRKAVLRYLSFVVDGPPRCQDRWVVPLIGGSTHPVLAKMFASHSRPHAPSSGKGSHTRPPLHNFAVAESHAFALAVSKRQVMGMLGRATVVLGKGLDSFTCSPTDSWQALLPSHFSCNCNIIIVH